MKHNLVIVESPAKARTIAKFLGKNFKVIASVGHVRDLPKSRLGVDLENDFTPKYINIRGKGDVINKIKDAAKKADKVYLATDPDREGEAISWHLEHILDIDPKEKNRVEFHEITKDIIQKAIKNPRAIDEDLVDAQQARRILDRIVGYKISPLLWNKVQKGLSAGRVQSVALKIVCDREFEIESFNPEEYWSIEAVITDGDKEYTAGFYGRLSGEKEEKLDIKNREEMLKIVSELDKKNYEVRKVRKGSKKRNSSPPFITSTLQQEASKKLGFASAKTMQIAQMLYEGVDVGEGDSVGLITYMRTDSVRLSEEAVSSASEYIIETYGKEYSKSTNYSGKKRKEAQDAHEAIRPTDTFRTPESISGYLTKDQFKLYDLIWKKFIASQMSPASYSTTQASIINNDYVFRMNAQHMKFAGYLIVYNDSEEKPESVSITLKGGEVLEEKEIIPKQHFTKPPARFTEASLIKRLEELNVGRPSTFATIVSILTSRSYCTIEAKAFVPTELGRKVNGILGEYFPDIINEKFTSEMEDKLDNIADGGISYKEVLKSFYPPFEKAMEKADGEIERKKQEVVYSSELCEKCGKPMLIKDGRYGKFLACSGFPECKNTKPILKEIGVKCPKCAGEVVELTSKGGKIFYGCSRYPECDYVSWDMPTNDKCEVCGSLMVLKKRKKGDFLKCSNTQCSFRTNTEKV